MAEGAGPDALPPQPSASALPIGDGSMLVLASSSPRRLELLGRLGHQPEVVAADIDESVRIGETPESYVHRVAAAKAEVVAGLRPGCTVLAADTTVALDGHVFAKPVDDNDARRILRILAGTVHQVLTAVALVDPQGSLEVRVVPAAVEFGRLTDDEVDWYVATGEPRGKAGAYAIQARGAVLVERIDGDPTTVIGLPLRATAEMLASAGIQARH